MKKIFCFFMILCLISCNGKSEDVNNTELSDSESRELVYNVVNQVYDSVCGNANAIFKGDDTDSFEIEFGGKSFTLDKNDSDQCASVSQRAMKVLKSMGKLYQNNDKVLLDKSFIAYCTEDGIENHYCFIGAKISLEKLSDDSFHLFIPMIVLAGDAKFPQDYYNCLDVVCDKKEGNYTIKQCGLVYIGSEVTGNLSNRNERFSMLIDAIENDVKYSKIISGFSTGSNYTDPSHFQNYPFTPVENAFIFDEAMTEEKRMELINLFGKNKSEILEVGDIIEWEIN